VITSQKFPRFFGFSKKIILRVGCVGIEPPTGDKELPGRA